jgi:DNA-binding MarR family transcriptional regulator
MLVSFLNTIIANKKPDYQIAIILFTKSDAEQIAEDDLSPAEWEAIVSKFSHDKYLNQIADELMADLVQVTIDDREKAGK